MKFTPKKCGKFSVEWKDGAKLHFETVRDDLVSAYMVANSVPFSGHGMLITKEKLSLKGWEGIEDQDGKPIPFSEGIRDSLYAEEIIFDNDLRKKIQIAMDGPLGN